MSHLRRDFGAVQPEGLAETALDPVAHHRLTDRARNGEAQTRPQNHCAIGAPVWRIAFARPAKGGEQRTGDAESVIIDEPEIGGAQNPGRPGKVERSPDRVG